MWSLLPVCCLLSDRKKKGKQLPVSSSIAMVPLASSLVFTPIMDLTAKIKWPWSRYNARRSHTVCPFTAKILHLRFSILGATACNAGILLGTSWNSGCWRHSCGISVKPPFVMSVLHLGSSSRLLSFQSYHLLTFWESSSRWLKCTGLYTGLGDPKETPSS